MRLRSDIVLRWSCIAPRLGRMFDGYLHATEEAALRCFRQRLHELNESRSCTASLNGAPAPVLADTDGRIVALLDPRALFTPAPMERV